MPSICAVEVPNTTHSAPKEDLTYEQFIYGLLSCCTHLERPGTSARTLELDGFSSVGLFYDNHNHSHFIEHWLYTRYCFEHILTC